MDDTKRDHKDRVWDIADPTLRGSWDAIQASILQDIRDALKGLTESVEMLLEHYEPEGKALPPPHEELEEDKTPKPARPARPRIPTKRKR